MLCMTRNSSGAMFLFGQGAPIQDELIVSLPTKWRWTINGGAAGPTARIIIILNGDNAWQGTGAVMTPMSKEPRRRVTQREPGSLVCHAYPAGSGKRPPAGSHQRY